MQKNSLTLSAMDSANSFTDITKKEGSLTFDFYIENHFVTVGFDKRMIYCNERIFPDLSSNVSFMTSSDKKRLIKMLKEYIEELESGA